MEELMSVIDDALQSKQELRQTLEELIAEGIDEIEARALLDLLDHDCLERVGAMWGMKEADYAPYYGSEEDYDAGDLLLELFVERKVLISVESRPDVRIRYGIRNIRVN